MSTNNYKVTGLHKLLEKLDAHQNSIVLLSVGDDVPKAQIKSILDTLIDYLEGGTLCVLGDCEFNTSSSSIEELVKLNNQERLVLSSNYALQLLSLRHDSYFLKHPSVSMGCVGHYARYLTRHQHLDFPYGKSTVFEDLYTLNAIYIMVGRDSPAFGLKYGYEGTDEKIITRNVCVYNDEVYAYLDFEADFQMLSELALPNSQFEKDNSIFYGAKYPDLINSIRKEI